MGGVTVSRRARQHGYSLIEVVVAFALLALALTLLLGTLSGATRQLRWSDDAGRAALHARSLLAEAGVEQPLRPGVRSGALEDGRYRWSLRVEPWEEPGLPPQPRDPAGGGLHALELQLQWGDGGPGEHLAVRSLRLLPPEPVGQ